MAEHKNEYHVKLRLIPFTTGKDDKNLEKKRKQTAISHKQTMVIIKRSLYGYDIIKYTIKDGWFNGYISPNKTFFKEISKGASVEDAILSTYTISAWTIWKNNNAITKTISLDIELGSILNSDLTKRIKYDIQLKLKPYNYKTITHPIGKKKTDLLKQKPIIISIVKSSLWGFDVIDYKFIKDIFHGVIVVNDDYMGDDVQYVTIRDNLISTYGDGAADGWMEGDITIGDDVELLIDFISVKIK